MHNGLGAPNGPGQQPFARWFRYPAGFSPAALDACFSAIGELKKGVVLDPFAGVGTTGTRCQELSLGFAGIEAHPLIAELAQLKFTRLGDTRRLIDKAISVSNSVRFSGLDTEHPLITGSYPANVLGTLVALREHIKAEEEGIEKDLLKWGLLGALRDCSTAGVGFPYQRPNLTRVPRISDPRRAFLRRVGWIAEDLERTPNAARLTVVAGDARTKRVWETALGGELASAAVSSPPYLNNFDYADATRLELYFWKYASSWREMTERVRSGMVVATTQQSRKTTAEADTKTLAGICPKTSSDVVALADELSEKRAERRVLKQRSKEYDQVIPSYFAGLALVLANMRNHCCSGAPVSLVLGDSAPYGVYVDTPSLIAQAATELDFEIVSVLPLRKRGLRWHSNGKRHLIELSEKLVLLRSPSRR